MILRSVTSISLAAALAAIPTLTPTCDPGPVYVESQFPLVIETCTVTIDGRTSREDIKDVVMTVGEDAAFIMLDLPVDCLDGAVFSETQVSGGHVDVVSGMGCGEVSPNGSSAGASFEYAAFDGIDTDGDGIFDGVTGEISLSWYIEDVIGPAVVYSEEVVCEGRAFSGSNILGPVPGAW